MARKTFVGCAIAFGLALAGLSAPTRGAVPALDQPNWAALAPEQKAILAPLAGDWNAMEAFRRKKWIGIAQRYPAMSPTEQISVQRNMRDWARLAPEERKAAREKYKTLKKNAPEQQQTVKEKWATYQALPQEERNRLRDEVARRPQSKTPPKPLATGNAHASAGVKIPTAHPLGSPLLPLKPLSPLKPPQSTPAPKAAIAPAPSSPPPLQPPPPPEE